MIICESDFDIRDSSNPDYFMEEVDFWYDWKTRTYILLRRRWNDKFFELVEQSSEENIESILCETPNLKMAIDFANNLRKKLRKGDPDKVCDHVYPHLSHSCKKSLDVEGRYYDKSMYDIGTSGDSDF